MNLFSNNPDFYPTPNEVIEQMMLGEDYVGKTVLDLLLVAAILSNGYSEMAVAMLLLVKMTHIYENCLMEFVRSLVTIFLN